MEDKEDANKRLLFSVHDECWTGERFSTEIIKFYIKQIRDKYGKCNKDMVLTVPAYFHGVQRQKMLDAGMSLFFILRTWSP